MGPLVTYLCERFDFRVTAITGSLLVSISFTVGSFASEFWLFFAMFSIIAGFGSCASYNCSVLVVLKYFVKWRLLAVGITASSSSVGMLAMSQITQVLLTKCGWRGVIRGWAVLFVLTALCACTYDPSIRAQQKSEENANQNPSKTNYSTVLRNGVFVVYLSSLSLVYFSTYVASIFLVRRHFRPTSTTGVSSCVLRVKPFFARVTARGTRLIPAQSRHASVPVLSGSLGNVSNAYIH